MADAGQPRLPTDQHREGEPGGEEQRQVRGPHPALLVGEAGRAPVLHPGEAGQHLGTQQAGRRGERGRAVAASRQPRGRHLAGIPGQPAVGDREVVAVGGRGAAGQRQVEGRPAERVVVLPAPDLGRGVAEQEEVRGQRVRRHELRPGRLHGHQVRRLGARRGDGVVPGPEVAEPEDAEPHGDEDGDHEAGDEAGRGVAHGPPGEVRGLGRHRRPRQRLCHAR
jgi:hypothetical protein